MASIKVISGMCIIPAGTTEIFGDTFRITNITIPASVKRIDNSAFDGLDLELIDVDVNNLDFYSEDNCLINKKGTELIRGCKNSIIPSGIKTIEPHAFFGCKSLKSITIPDTVTYIGYSSFEGCTSLEEIVIPSSVTYIDSFAFRGCHALKKVVFKTTSIKEIDRGLFEDCLSLEEITVPEGVKSICNRAFCGCKSLRSVKLPRSLERLEFYGEVFAGCNLDTITIDPSNNYFHVKGNCLLNENCTILIRGCNSSTIPDTVKLIGDDAFSGCTRLAGIVIPDGVEEIGTRAFENCTALTGIDIPKSVESVSKNAFHGCVNLQNIKISKSTEFDINSSFRGCPNAIKNGLYSGLVESLKREMNRMEPEISRVRSSLKK
ncbi:MAG: leucine-rich repeat domain-containing protein [Bacteroidales bacterium]|nr:leucine-rich repeat domain-containing protein [Bacteroidales bacterium]